MPDSPMDVLHRGFLGPAGVQQNPSEDTDGGMKHLQVKNKNMTDSIIDLQAQKKGTMT